MYTNLQKIDLWLIKSVSAITINEYLIQIETPPFGSIGISRLQSNAVMLVSSEGWDPGRSNDIKTVAYGSL